MRFPTGKLIIAAAAAVTALAVPLWLVPEPAAIYAIKHFGYWAVLGTLVLFAYSARGVAGAFRWARLTALARDHAAGILAVLAVWGLLHVHTAPGFNVLHDEYVLGATAKSLFQDARAYTEAVAHTIDGETLASLGFVDKRPLLFPSLLALAHTVFGFRPENAFLLNSILGLALLAALYGMPARWCGKSHGILGVLAVGGLPLLAENTAGGGYDVLNLLLIALVAAAGARYLAGDDRRDLDLLVLSSVLLANVRQESLAYTLVPVLLFAGKSLRDRSVRLTWTAALSPLLLLPPLFSLSVFQSDNRFIATDRDNFFALSHFPGNLREAALYLFDTSAVHTNSLFLSAAGLVCGLLLLVRIVRAPRAFPAKSPLLSAFCAVAAVALLNTALVLSCHWGEWTDAPVARFSLPFQLCLALAIPLAARFDFGRPRAPKWLLGLAAAYALPLTPGHNARLDAANRFFLADGNAWAVRWLDTNAKAQNPLVIGDSSIGYQLHGYAAIPTRVANAAPRNVWQLRQTGIYDGIFVLQPMVAGHDRRLHVPPNRTRPHPDLRLKPVAQKAFGTTTRFRISRVTGFDGAEDPAAQTRPAPEQSFHRFVIDILPLLPEREP